MAVEENRPKTTAELLAGIRPPEEEEEDRYEEQPEPEETEGDGEAEGDAPDDDGGEEAGEGKAKPAKDAKAKRDAKETPEEYFARQREQRKSARDLSRELEAERDRVARMEREMAELRQRIDAGFAPQAKAEPKDDVNPFDQDDRPVEHAQWEVAQTKKKVAELQAQIDDREKQQQTLSQQTEQEQAVALYAEQVDAELNTAFQEIDGFGPMFAAYNGALIDHYMGKGADRKSATRQATLDHLNIAYVGSRRGLTPAEAIYQHAERLGFQPQAFASQVETPKPKTEATTTPNLDGARSASRRAPRSINSAPGSGGRNARSVEALAGKRDKDWEKNDYKSLFSALRQKAGAY